MIHDDDNYSDNYNDAMESLDDLNQRAAQIEAAVRQALEPTTTTDINDYNPQDEEEEEDRYTDDHNDLSFTGEATEYNDLEDISLSSSSSGYCDEEMGDMAILYHNDDGNDDGDCYTVMSSSTSISSVLNGVISSFRHSYSAKPTRGMEDDAKSLDYKTRIELPLADTESLSSASASSSTDTSSSGNSIHDLVRELRSQRLQKQTQPESDTEVALRIQNYAKARQLRRFKYKGSHTRPWGLIGLSLYLAQVRLDLEWAQDAAYRRAHVLPYLSWADFEHLHSTKKQLGGNSKKKTPWFLYILLTVSTVLLIYSMALNDWKFENLHRNPMLGPSTDVLLRLGALQTSKIVTDADWYRLLAPAVLHAGLVHYALNALALGLLSTLVECLHGSWVTAGLFVVSAVGGNLASAIFAAPHTVSVGASGGIYGLLGVCAADCWSNWDVLTFLRDNDDEYSPDGFRFPVVPVVAVVALDVIVNFCVGLTPLVDNFAHTGGFVYGLLLGLVFSERLRNSGFFGQPSRRRRVCVSVWRWTALAAAVALFMTTLGVLYMGDPETGRPPNVCPACQHLSCVPMPFWKDEEHKWWDCDNDCAHTRGNIVTREGMTTLELECPDGEATVYIDLGSSAPAIDEIKKSMAGYCRSLC